MPKPYVPTNKKTLYGTQANQSQERDDPPREKEYKPTYRICAICGRANPKEWYELMNEGWVCDPCRPKATAMSRETQIEHLGSES